MRYFVFVFFSLFSHSVIAQPVPTYEQLLKLTPELRFVDSGHITTTFTNKIPVDSLTIKKIFPNFYDSRSRDLVRANNYLVAKIISFTDYDLILFLNESKVHDDSINKYIFLISFTKEGKYLDQITIAWNALGEKSPHGDTWFFKDGSFFIYTQLNTDGTDFLSSITKYKTNEYGIFVFYPN